MKIGIYSFAHTHAAGYARALLGRTDVELLASDPDAASRPSEAGGPELANELGLPYVDSLEALLDWEPDGVIVCTENAGHRAAVEAIAARGIHVLCEKPLATNLADADAMIEACERAGVVLMVAYPVRFSCEFDAFKAAIDGSAIGNLRAISGANNGKLPLERRWFSDPELAGGGAIMDHTVHIADLLDVLMPDARAVNVFARANDIMHAERASSETAGIVSIEYSNGVIATIDCSWSMPDHSPIWGGLKVQALGTEGLADVDAFHSQRIDGFSERQAADIRINYGVDSNLPMLETFLEAVVSGRQPQPDGHSARRSLAIALAAYDSLRAGGPAPVQ